MLPFFLLWLGGANATLGSVSSYFIHIHIHLKREELIFSAVSINISICSAVNISTSAEGLWVLVSLLCMEDDENWDEDGIEEEYLRFSTSPQYLLLWKSYQSVVSSKPPTSNLSLLSWSLYNSELFFQAEHSLPDLSTSFLGDPNTIGIYDSSIGTGTLVTLQRFMKNLFPAAFLVLIHSRVQKIIVNGQHSSSIMWCDWPFACWEPITSHDWWCTPSTYRNFPNSNTQSWR